MIGLAAVEAIGLLTDSRAYEHLLQLICDEDRDIRFTRAVAPGEPGDKRAVIPLQKAR